MVAAVRSAPAAGSFSRAGGAHSSAKRAALHHVWTVCAGCERPPLAEGRRTLWPSDLDALLCGSPPSSWLSSTVLCGAPLRVTIGMLLSTNRSIPRFKRLHLILVCQPPPLRLSPTRPPLPAGCPWHPSADETIQLPVHFGMFSLPEGMSRNGACLGPLRISVPRYSARPTHHPAGEMPLLCPCDGLRSPPLRTRPDWGTL